MAWTEGSYIDLLPGLQAVAARYSGPMSYDHPGQLAWGSIFDGREAPAVIAGGDAYGILESPHWLQAGGNPDRVGEVLEWARSRASGFNVMALDGPVGCAAAHRRRGLGGGVTRAALAAAREQGATIAIVRPRGDPGYPVPSRLYRSLGFTDHARTREFRCT